MLILTTSFTQPIAQELWSKYIAMMPAHIKDTITSFQRWQDQHSTLFGKLLLLKGLSKLGHHQSLNEIKLNKYGKPYLQENIFFNISHSGYYVVCAFSDLGDVGIDIEFIDKKIDIFEFKNMFTSFEWLQIATAIDPIDKFFTYWSLKESAIKADGSGMSAPLLDCHIEGNTISIGETQWHFKELSIHQHYKAFVSSAHKISSVVIELIDLTSSL
jgi:4'-phosphopantetheinyl transferase